MIGRFTSPFPIHRHPSIKPNTIQDLICCEKLLQRLMATFPNTVLSVKIIMTSSTTRTLEKCFPRHLQFFSSRLSLSFFHLYILKNQHTTQTSLMIITGATLECGMDTHFSSFHWSCRDTNDDYRIIWIRWS